MEIENIENLINLYEEGNLSNDGIINLMQILNDEGYLYNIKNILEKKKLLKLKVK